MSTGFSEQLLAFLPRLRRFARSLTGSADKADDLVQITCAKALSAQSSWTPDTRFDSWMFRIARNAWIDTLRRTRHEKGFGDAADYEDIPGLDGESATIARMTLTTVLAAIDQLPPDQREVLVLTVMEEFSYAEVAEMLGIPIGTVMSRLARAREKIALAAGIDRKSKR